MESWLEGLSSFIVECSYWLYISCILCSKFKSSIRACVSYQKWLDSYAEEEEECPARSSRRVQYLEEELLLSTPTSTLHAAFLDCFPDILWSFELQQMVLWSGSGRTKHKILFNEKWTDTFCPVWTDFTFLELTTPAGWRYCLFSNTVFVVSSYALYQWAAAF